MRSSSFKDGSSLKEKEHLQAVILTETFNDYFEPLAVDYPLVLMPLVNTPLLDYSLDWLQRCDIDEVIIYCCSQPHSDKIKEHCRRWSSFHGGAMEVKVVVSENCSSLGDAMRDLYSKSFLKGDFFLLSGDMVGNLDLKSLLETHRARREKDRSAVMTCVYLDKPMDRKKPFDDSRVVNLVSSATNGKILMHFRPSKSNSFSIPVDIVQTYPQLRINKRVQDTNVAICSDIIPSLFSDNFDYGTRDSLIQGVIEQEELMGYSICGHILREGYAARVTSFAAYQEISEAIMKRINFPSVPERSLSSQRIRYQYQSFTGTYWDPSAKFHKKSLGDDVVIDAGSEISPNSTIENAVIGKLCSIKDKVCIRNSFIMSNVTIHEGCVVNQCFIGNNVTILQNVTIEPGVIIGNNVIVGPDINIDRSTRLSLKPPVDDFTGEPQKQVPDISICGKGGRAFRYDISDEAKEGTLVWGTEHIEHCDEEGSDDDSSVGDDDDQDFMENQEEEAMMSDEEREQEFIKEVNDSLLNAYREKSAPANVVLEINASRHAYNVTMEDVLLAITTGILCVDQQDSKETLSGEALRNSVKKGMTRFTEVLVNYIKKERDQLIMLKAIEQLCKNPRYASAVVPDILHKLNQEMEILDDDVIIGWFDGGGLDKNAFICMSKIPRLSAFVDWLRQSSEEESEED